MGSAIAASPGKTEVKPSSKTEDYSWGRAKIVGGGFIPGIIFNAKEKNLIYARTDIGGAYRWDPASKKWIQLLDSIGMSDWNNLGVESLATDPVDPNRLYLAVGTYTNEWTDDNGYIFRSTDRGKTWKKTQLPFKLGGNMPGRSMGERLVIDPNDNKILYFGARSGNGLWKSVDYGATWKKVDSFTAKGSVSDDYFKDPLGTVWVTFDPTTGSKGKATQTIYVGVAERENSIYKSTDGGKTWAPVTGQPTQGFLPQHGVLNANGVLYVTYAHDVGPYNGGEGSVWKLDTKTGVWTDISPTGVGDKANPYGGLAVDAQHPDTVMVATMNKWWPDEFIYRSTDGGATWKPFTTYDYSVGWPPARTDEFTIDYALSPWLDWGSVKDPKQTPEISPKLGWMIGDLEIDPFNSNRILYGTGATLYGSDNVTAIDSGGKVKISVYADGIEETAIQGLISPPSGAPLLSAMADIGGFRHESLDKAPNMITNPYMGTTTDLDYAETNPNLVVRVGNENGINPSMGVSTDNGKTWTPAKNPWTPLPLTGEKKDQPDPADQTNGGWVAVSADGKTIVWSPEASSASVSRPVSFTKDNGATWTASKGIPAGAMVSSDRKNANKIYGFLNGKFYVSTDGGKNFTVSKASGLPKNLTSKFKAIPGKDGDIWLAGVADKKDKTISYGLFHSTDSGNSFTKLKNMQEAATIGFGKAAPGKSYMALYTDAKINNQYGIYRSDDAGASWIRINDDQHQFGAASRTITGDPRVFGRVYIGTNGLGIVVGNPAGGKH
ncbi:sialidase family protein [Gorillibacterium massiliense]|uniref:sialidase family protein n=1 Tax=Gorillibacterium massiliense TaxID=1280390 RepID=UPI0012DED8C9|nr:sialidase family protein [Gorillibacterium massiliense]